MSKEIELQLRKAITKSGVSYSDLMDQSGVDAAIICRFVKDQRTMTLRNASRLAKALGIEFTQPKKDQ
jgi:ribosome-binding protein aMBF1 (putative translation factor)